VRLPQAGLALFERGQLDRLDHLDFERLDDSLHGNPPGSSDAGVRPARAEAAQLLQYVKTMQPIGSRTGEPMPSTLYLGTDQEQLAQALRAQLEAETSAGDFFTPANVVVANRYVAKWLRLWLAREWGVVANLRIDYLLERKMWQMLQEVAGREQTAPLQLISDGDYQLMILASFLGESGPTADDPLRGYLGRPARERRRAFWRRAWQLAGQLTGLLRDYEYHRHDLLIQPWLNHRDAYPDAPPADLYIERSQRELFEQIVRQPDGLRARLSRAMGKSCKTLPQYAAEVMALPASELRKPAEQRALHLFGLSQISAMHVQTLRWLGEHYSLCLYHLNPLAGRLDGLTPEPAAARAVVRDVADRFRKPDQTAPAAGDDLLGAWAPAAAESLWLMADFLDGPRPFAAKVIADRRPAGKETVLARVQCQLCNRTVGAERLAQDVSVQVVACPGVLREVETVYQSILDNLQRDPTLRQTDIAVLVTDMSAYRPAIQAVFDRAPRMVVYNLADYSAAELGPLGSGVIGLLDLALESFTRSRVIEVILNPCFLARLGVDREQALVWSQWAEELGIYNGWDRQDKRARGYADSPLYSWQLGLRRLRLGRLMEVTDERAEVPAAQFQGVIPFADLTSGDKEQLDVFCRAIEGLLPRLARLRGLSSSAKEWADELRALIEDFLEAPADRPQEEAAREALFVALEKLKTLDQLCDRPVGLPLALVREFVQDNLTTLEATIGEFLTGGVTVSALQPLLPVPFRIIYVLGLGESLFPGSTQLPAFDLRGRERCGGDIRPAETNRYLFLQTLLAAHDKVYLLYNSHDLQKDQELYPCSLVTQLSRSLGEHVLQGDKLEVALAPLRPGDVTFIKAESRPGDCLVTYSETDRLLALEEARKGGALRLKAGQVKDIEQRLRKARRTFSLPATAATAPSEVPTISLAELRGFLQCPAEAALKRHLRLRDDEEAEPIDDEPFFTGFPYNYRLTTAILERFVAQAVKQSMAEALRNWPTSLAALYEEWRLRGRVPEGAFGTVDRTRFEQELRQRIEGPRGLTTVLDALRGAAFCGPVLVGESISPVGAKRRFPAVEVSLNDGNVIRLVGSLPLLWRSNDALDVLVITNQSRINADQLNKPLLEPVLLYLAIKADRSVDALSARVWAGERRLRVHIAHAQGVAQCEFPADEVTAEEARAYLATLAHDFLDAGTFDLLPFDLIAAKEILREGYVADDDALPSPKEYCSLLEEAVDEDGEKDFHALYQKMKLLEIVNVKVPADALDKVRRRFRLLDRGPARARAGKRPEKRRGKQQG
jgi:exonuclease V gamma subunit